MNLFEPIERKSRSYQRKARDFGPHILGIPGLFERPPGNKLARRAGNAALSENKLPLQDITERTLLAHYAPIGALVSERGDILYLLDRTGRYLAPLQAKPACPDQPRSLRKYSKSFSAKPRRSSPWRSTRKSPSVLWIR